MRLVVRPDWFGDSNLTRTPYSVEQIIGKLKAAVQNIALGIPLAHFYRVFSLPTRTHTAVVSCTAECNQLTHLKMEYDRLDKLF